VNQIASGAEGSANPVSGFDPERGGQEGQAGPPGGPPAGWPPAAEPDESGAVLRPAPVVGTAELVDDPPGAAVALPRSGPEALSAGAAARVAASVPASTRRAYGGDWARFTAWCAGAGQEPLPARGETLAEYAHHLATAGRAGSTIGRALAAITSAHRAAGVPVPDRGLARAVLRAYARERAVAGTAAPVKAAPVTISALRAMVDVLDLDRSVGVRDRAVLVLGFALGARRSELAALDLPDLRSTPEGLEVLIRTSKTDKDSAGRIVAVPYGSHPGTCPVRTVQAWIALLEHAGRSSGPLFVRIDRHDHLGQVATGRGSPDGRLTGQAIAQIVQRTATSAGLPASAAWSGHSLRRGFATETYRAGADPLRIARHGGWTDGSATLLGYIDEVDRWKTNPLVGVGL
jgi:site-specific recombinase XerD